MRIARVIPDVTGLDKQFDYLIPESFGALGIDLAIGDIVRFELHGRRVRGWVVDLPASSAVAADRLRPLLKRSSAGPSSELLELGEWAAHRWAAGRIRPLLVAASPDTNVAGRFPAVLASVDSDGGDVAVVRLAPSDDPLPAVIRAVEATAPGSQLLVLHPSIAGSSALAKRLARQGVAVARWPEQWAAAANGTAQVVVGTRRAAWARVARLGGAVVVDEHDEALQEERTPTWHARDVLVERCRRWSVPCTLISPVPTVTAVVDAEPSGAAEQSRNAEAARWPIIDIIDRGDVEPWRRRQLSSPVIAALRDHSKRVLCVINTPGRSRLLACRSCAALVRCIPCGATVTQRNDDSLLCLRCGTQRPAICQACSSTALANVRPGVSRLAEELTAAAARPVVSVTADVDPIPEGDVFVGTEAALHRLGGVDRVAFLDFDGELLAPRYRAGEQAMTLLMRAARMVGRRERGGRVLVETRLPDHPVLRAALLGDPARFTAAEQTTRQTLGLPPFAGLAKLTGSSVDEAAALLTAAGQVQLAPDGDSLMVRAANWDVLADALAELPRSTTLRIAVDPPR